MQRTIEADPRILAVIKDASAPQALLASVEPPASLPGRVGLLANVYNVVGMARSGADHAVRLHERYGDIYRYSWGRDQRVFVWDPDEVQKILRNEDGAWSTGMGWDSFVGGRLLTNGGNTGFLLSLDFESHRAARKLLQPAFGNKAVKGYIELAQPMFADAVRRWLARGEVGFKSAARGLLADVANVIFTGVSSKGERDEIDRGLREIWGAALTLTESERLSPDLRKGRNAASRLNEYFASLFAQRRAEPGRDMYSQLVVACETDHPAPSFFSSFVGIMLAAYDTTSMSVTSMAYLLAKHPAWQERLRAEALSVSELDAAALSKLEQQEWVWKETLRLMPMAAFLPRRALREVEVLGHRLPAGCSVSLPIGPLGRVARHWPDPTRFDPERFSPARIDKRRMSLFMPFGAGPHACIGLQLAGLEAKLLFRELLTRCRFELAPDYEGRHTSAPLGVVSGAVNLKLTPL